MDVPAPPSLPPVAPAERPRRKSILDVGPVGVLIATVAGSCGAWHWMLDLFSHFRWYYFVISIVWLILLWRSKHRKSKWCFELALIWNGVLLLPYYVPVDQKEIPASTTTVSLISVNVFTANQNKSAVVDYLRERHPDLVVVIEVDLKWAEALHALKDIYPHIFIQPRFDNFGIGVLSRRPLIEPKIVEFSGTEIPTVVTKVDIDGKLIQLVATHPLPPIGAGNTDERNSQLRDVADFVKQSLLPTILAGDLNATPWSVAFRDVIFRSGLRDSALGRGVHGTWNAKTMIRIPIDHALIPPEAIVVQRAVGPNVGSDHFPLEITIALP